MDRCMEGILQRNSMALYSLALGHLTPKVKMEMEKRNYLESSAKTTNSLKIGSLVNYHISSNFAGEFCGRQCLAN